MTHLSARQTAELHSGATTTWRYLRLAMLALVVGLGAAVITQVIKTPDGRFLTSISAYYYTPARGYFVGALIGIAVCEVCLRGNTPLEDVLLNFAGMFGSVVALVPTPPPSLANCHVNCRALRATIHARDAAIANNLVALLVVGVLCTVVAGVRLRRRKAVTALEGWWLGSSIAAIIAAGLLFALDRSLFSRDAHYVAATLMFICIVIVVIDNAWGYKHSGENRSLRNRYAVVAVGMIALLVVIGIAGLVGWAYWLIALETAFIGPFAVFWLLQTVELWSLGLRDFPPLPPKRANYPGRPEGR